MGIEEFYQSFVRKEYGYKLIIDKYFQDYSNIQNAWCYMVMNEKDSIGTRTPDLAIILMRKFAYEYLKVINPDLKFNMSLGSHLNLGYASASTRFKNRINESKDLKLIISTV